MPARPKKIETFNFAPGRKLARKYEVLSKLGEGWEGEVYLLSEVSTGIERAAKFFYPKRNVNNKALNFYAKKLHKLRDCPALIQYHTQESIIFQGSSVSFLVSDFVEGQILLKFLSALPQKKLDVFQGLHLLYALATAVEAIHKLNDYHGDLHPGNVIIQRKGLGFDIKLLDFFHWGDHPKTTNIRDDLVDVIRIFYEAIGGKKHYAKAPPVAREIILGLKKSLILKKFPTLTVLREYLENLNWDEIYH